MTFRIESAKRGKSTIFTLSGRLEGEAIPELRKLLERQTDLRDTVLDLKDVRLVDRDAMHFFARCEANGVKLEKLSPYIREWMEREKD